MNAVVHGKCDRCHQFVEWRTTGGLTVDQKVKVVLFYAETKSVVATQRCFRAHFDTRWACKRTIYRLSLGTIFQPVRIISVPDVKCFFKNKKVLCLQSMVWHFVCHPVFNDVFCMFIDILFSFVIKSPWKWLVLTWNMQGNANYKIAQRIILFVKKCNWNYV